MSQKSLNHKVAPLIIRLFGALFVGIRIVVSGMIKASSDKSSESRAMVALLPPWASLASVSISANNTKLYL